MNSEDEQRLKEKTDSPSRIRSKSKSATKLTDESKKSKNSYLKRERSYKVGNYLIKNTLGSGTFGKVKLGIYIPTNEKVAVKILEKSKMTEKDDQIRLEREFEMLAQFNHPNLIMVTEIFESDNNYYTVMDYCDGGELFNYIVKNKYLSEEEASFFYYQLISGLEYIHSLGIVHRDLKPENLLLTNDHILKIIDFGLSNYFKEGQNELLYTPCGSPCYASPEMVTGNNYDGVMIDIWSTGIILFAMLCGYLPFEDKNNEKLFKKIAECKIEYPEYLSEVSLDLLKKIIVPNPKERITIPEIKKHPFYLKGKKLFDKEFTIQFISDEAVNNEKNADKKDDSDKAQDKDKQKDNSEEKKEKKEKNNSIDDGFKEDNSKEIKESIQKIEKDLEIEENNNKNENNEEIKEDKQKIEKDKDKEIEIKENKIEYKNQKNKEVKDEKQKIEKEKDKDENKISNNNNDRNNDNNIINNQDSKEKDNKDIKINNAIDEKNNNNYDNKNIDRGNTENIKYNKKIISEKFKNRSIDREDTNEKSSVNNNNDTENLKGKIKKVKNLDDVKKTKKIQKNIKINTSNINTNTNTVDKSNNEFFQEQALINNINNNANKKINLNINCKARTIKPSFFNSFNIISIEEINNSTNAGTTINFTNPNIMNDIKINNGHNSKKSNKQIDKNYLLIEELNNSVDNKKMRNNNILDLYSNYANVSKEKKKKTNDLYGSSTFNANKNKNRLKSSKIIDSVFGKILKINKLQKSRDKKDNLKIREKKRKMDTKKTDDDFNQKIFSTRNTFCEGDSKLYEKKKVKMKSKERKSEMVHQKNTHIFNPKSKQLDSYNNHKFTMSTDIKDNITPIDLRSKKLKKNIDNIKIYDNNKGNKSVRQDLIYPLAIKKSIKSKANYTEESMKINSNSINKNKKIYSNNNKINNNNNEIQDYILKTEENEILYTDLGNNSLEPNPKHKFKMNTNLFKLETKFSTKDTNKIKKNTLYQKQSTGVYSSNNLKNFKINNGIILKNNDKSKLNDERMHSNRKRNYQRKFNNLSGVNNIHNSENKTKKFNKIFIQKKVTDITSSYSSKLNNNFNSRTNFSNYNINITNSKERKKTSSKNKSIKMYEKKTPMLYIEDGISSIDYDLKNNINMNIFQSIKNNNNKSQAKFIRQIKKNNNYIHIKRKQIKNIDKRNKSKSIVKNKSKQKSNTSEEAFSLKEIKNSNNINTMRNPFHIINKTSFLNDEKNLNQNKQKINMKKNNMCDNNGSNPYVNIRNTFISFNMYPKYYLDQKKQLSSPKIERGSPQHQKYRKNANLKIYSNKKIGSISNNIHLRQNTSPGVESPAKKSDINNFMNIQNNIFNSIDNHKLFYYTNTEYDDNQSMSNNINIDTINNMKNRPLNRKYQTLYKELSSNYKTNKDLSSSNNINSLSNNQNLTNKNLSNTLSPNNDKKFSQKLNTKIIKSKNAESLQNMNAQKKHIYLANFENYENDSDKKKRDIEIISPVHKYNYVKKNNIINALEKLNCNTTTNKNLSTKYGITFKISDKNNFNFNN